MALDASDTRFVRAEPESPANPEPPAPPGMAPAGPPSTGPRPPEGKARVARNAVTHGLTAHAVVLPEEDPRPFQQFRAGLLADWAPVGGDERLLVERMVAANWRLQRLWRVESGLYWYHREYQGTPNLHVTVAYLDDCRREEAFSRQGRQESTLNREYHFCARRLLVMQDLRRKGLRPSAQSPVEQPAATQAPAPVPPPAAQPVADTPQGTAHAAATPGNGGTSGEIAEQTPPAQAGEAEHAVQPVTLVEPSSIPGPATPWQEAGSGEIAEQTPPAVSPGGETRPPRAAAA